MRVTTQPQTSTVRRAARVLALLPALLVTSTTGAAFADAPDQWADNPSVSPLFVLLVMAVIPVGLFLLITLLVYLPSMSRGESYRPGQVWRGEPTWFGGPRGGVDAVEVGATQPAVGSGDHDAGTSGTGGTSGRW